nr:hypothetical protein B0A51_16629 [Rachicladosporium sp. CCFEE 5018]
MLPPGLSTPHEVSQYYDELYYEGIASGKFRPFVYPFGALGGFLVLLALILDNRRSRIRRYAVYATYAFMCCFHVWCMVSFRARNAAAAFGLGLIAAFSNLFIGAVGCAIYRDDCRRLQRRSGGAKSGTKDVGANGPASSTGTEYANGSNVEGDARHRLLNGAVSNTLDHNVESPLPPFYWQTVPQDSLIERFDWVLDAFTSFRGIGWTWQRSGLPLPPSFVEDALAGAVNIVERPEPVRVSKTGVRRLSDRAALVRESAINLVLGYIVLDAVKTLGIHDPYMWGYMDAAPPAFLPEVIRQSFALTRIYRLSISCTAIYTALWFAFKLGPFFFCGVLGPEWIGLRGEAWMNPACMFGSFRSVLDHGLAGWWGGWWHQTFRMVFEEPAGWLIARLGLEQKSAAGSLVSVFTAFFLSGCLHASGSYTQLGDTRPILGQMRFFLLQACGVTLQTFAARGLKSAGITQRLPKRVRQLGNLVTAMFWMYHTAPLLCDDFARGGIWLFEPVPISIFRGLGLGPKGGGGWWLWNDLFAWRTGEHWWNTGIAL